VNKFISAEAALGTKNCCPTAAERGDIIVFKVSLCRPPAFCERVIGLPGDHVKFVDQLCISRQNG